MILASLLSMAFAASPAAWKLEVAHDEKVDGALIYQGYMNRIGLTEQLAETFVVKITEPAADRPKALDLSPRGGSVGHLTLRDIGGEAEVRYDTIPLAESRRAILSSYLERLLLADPHRAAMAACNAEGTAAAEKWLRANLALLLLTAPDDLKLSNLQLKCGRGKLGVVHEVSVAVKAARGRTLLDATLKGKISVDPQVWITTWKLGGPLRVVFDTRGLNLQVNGTFSTALSLKPSK